MTEYKKETDYYRGLNRVVEKGGIVLFGSTFARNIPVAELSQAFYLNRSICNRSYNDLSVFDAYEVARESVMPLFPEKIIIQLGETDLERGYKSVDEIITAYSELISKLGKQDRKLKIVIASVCVNDNESSELNRKLEVLAGKSGCQYADITGAVKTRDSEVKAFGLLRRFIMEKMTFCDAMNLANY